MKHAHLFSRLLDLRVVGIALLLVLPLGCNNQPAAHQSDQQTTDEVVATDKPAADPTDEPSQATVEHAEEKPKALTIGSPAPELSIAKWIHGESFEGFNPGHTYVVEFWATWCPPCRASMPHISELQAKLKDQVTFVGITKEDEETVRAFLEKQRSEDSEETWGEAVQYALALDAEGVTDERFMDAAGRTGIPAAFIVGGDGHIEWIGHPMRIDDPLDQVVSGSWDREKYLAEYEKEQREREEMRVAMKSLSQAQREGDWDKAIALTDELIEKFPERSQFGFYKLRFLLRAKRPAEAASWASDFAKNYWDNSRALNSIAWSLAKDEAKSSEVLEVALELGKRADELTEGKDATVLDTIARIHYEKGDLDEAIAWQERAVELDESNKKIQQILREYLAERDGDKSGDDKPEEKIATDEDPTETTPDTPAEAETTGQKPEGANEAGEVEPPKSTAPAS